MHMRGCHVFCAVCTSAYLMEEHKNYNGSDKSVSTRAHAQSLNTHHRKTYLNVPHGGDNENAVVYIGIATNYLSS